MNRQTALIVRRATLCHLFLFVTLWSASIQAAPSSEPASAPATASAPAAETEPTAPPPLSAIEHMLLLDDRDRELLKSVHEGASPEEPALYMMLQRLARLPQLSDAELFELDRPGYKNLLRHPYLYRGDPQRGEPIRPILPIRLKVRVFETLKLTAGKGLSPNRRWDKTRPIWKMQCLMADAKVPADQPLILYSLADPTDFLGSSTKQESEDHYLYSTGPTVHVAGVFYKTMQAMESASERAPQLRDYPVVLTWQLFHDQADRPAMGSGGSELTVMMVVGVILFLGFFFFLRFYYLPKKGDTRKFRGDYRPRREETKKAPAPDEPIEPVDPLLKEAAEEFRKRKNANDPNGPS